MSKKDKTPEQAIEDTIEAFRKNITKKYLTAIQLHQYEVQKIVKKFYENPANEGKDVPEIPEPEIETSDQTKSLYKKWEPLLAKYKEITGKTYKKPILFNENKEKSKKAGLKEKLDARQLRDALLAKKEAAKPVAKAKPKPVPKNTGYAEAKKLYNKPQAQLEEVTIPSAKIAVKKINKDLFTSMKDLIKIEEKAQQVEEEVKVDKRALFKAKKDAKKAEQELKVDKRALYKAKQEAKKAEKELKVDKRALFKAKQEAKQVPVKSSSKILDSTNTEEEINVVIDKFRKKITKMYNKDPDPSKDINKDLSPKLKKWWKLLTDKYQTITGTEYTKSILTEPKIDKRALYKANQEAKKNAKALFEAKIQQEADAEQRQALFESKIEKEVKRDKRALFKEKKIKSIPNLQPWYPEEHGNKDRTGRLMSDEEIAQLQRIRAKLKQSKIPENIIVEPAKRRGRPVVEGSKRQAKLAEPVTALKRRGRPAKKVPVEETKEETRQEETKEEPVMPKRRGRPIVEGSKRQAKLAQPKKSVGRPKVDKPPAKRPGRPNKCDSVEPKSDVLLPVTHIRPVINWFEVEEKKYKLKSTERVSDKLLRYNKLTPEIFFDIMDVLLPVELGNEIRTFYDKYTSRQQMFIVFRKLCEYIIGSGLATANAIEHALAVRLQGELAQDPKKLRAFERFLHKNCIDKQGVAQVSKKSVTKPKKEIVYSLEELVPFSEVKYDFKKNKIIDIVKNTFVGKQASIRKVGDKYQRVQCEYDEEDEDESGECEKVWDSVSSKIAGFIVDKLLDQAEEIVPELHEKLSKQYDDDKDQILQDIKDWLNTLE